MTQGLPREFLDPRRGFRLHGFHIQFLCFGLFSLNTRFICFTASASCYRAGWPTAATVPNQQTKLETQWIPARIQQQEEDSHRRIKKKKKSTNAFLQGKVNQTRCAPSSSSSPALRKVTAPSAMMTETTSVCQSWKQKHKGSLRTIQENKKNKTK